MNDELREHLAAAATSEKEPPTEADLLIAANVLRDRATREGDSLRGSLTRVADFAEEAAPTIGLLKTMMDNGTLPDLGGLFGSRTP